MTHTYLDLFAGAGGWDVAAHHLGWAGTGVENMPAAVATRTAAGHTTAYRDVWDGLDDPSIVPTHDVLIASPPCQTFSAAGKGAGRHALDDVLTLIHDGAHTRPGLRTTAVGMDPRTALVLTPLAYAWQHHPTYLAWEQVPAVLPVWEACADALRTIGYDVVTGILNAEQHGVPQTRRRAFLVARRDGHPAVMPTPTHSRYYPRDPGRLDLGVEPWVSMADALGYGRTRRPAVTVIGGGTQTAGDLSCEVNAVDWVHRRASLNAQARNSGPGAARNPRDIELPSYTIRAQGSGSHPSDVEWTETRPATTVVGSFNPDVIAAPGYRTVGGPSRQDAPGSVRVTIDEAATLQGFPPGYPFQGGKGAQFLQCGNAVPPPLARAVLSALVGVPA